MAGLREHARHARTLLPEAQGEKGQGKTLPGGGRLFGARSWKAAPLE
jgi:hypothetical protein